MPPESTRTAKKESSGPIVGAIIVVLLLIVGGLYFWNDRAHQNSQEPLPLIVGDTSTTTTQ